ncbi:MAG: DUF642 domain-containing protein [Planctomycetes bacterium]|nr:DUF642 domain-containing protein [Planctomycetota bacterium]
MIHRFRHLVFRPCVLANAVALAAGCSAVASAQNIVFNGGFESPVLNGGWIQRFPGTTFGGWLVDNLGQGVVQVGSFGAPASIQGSQSVELNFYQTGGISQTLNTWHDTYYVVSFLMAGQLNAGPDVKQLRVDWDGSPLGTISWSHSATGGQWVRQSLVAHATTGNTVLHFLGVTPAAQDGGPYIDDVSVVPCLAITRQPTQALACADGSATLSIDAAGAGPLAYQWQIETSSGVWAGIGHDPMPLSCGGFVFAQPPNASTTNIGVRGCTGQFRIRCVVSSSCGIANSNPVALTVCACLTCPADFNQDGGVDGSDVAAFFDRWELGNCDADTNQDGGVDGADVDAFFEAWETGNC